MVEYPKCLYRYKEVGGSLIIEGVSFETCLVDGEDEESASASDGWSTVPMVSVVALEQPSSVAEVTREELEQRAKAVGVKVKKSMSDKDLALAVMEAEAK
jgi:hypothetical protein